MNTTTKTTVEFGVLGFHNEKGKWIKAPTTWKGYDDEEAAKKFFSEFLKLWDYKIKAGFCGNPNEYREFKLSKRTVITITEDWQDVE